MNSTKILERILFVVDRCLRKTFPDSFDARCIYAAHAIEHLLHDAGIDAHLSGGNAMILVASVDGNNGNFQGFGSKSSEPSHFWVERDEMLIDIGLSYLPNRSSFPAANMPFIAWKSKSTLPPYLRYDTQIRYLPLARIEIDSLVTQKLESFLFQCRKRFNSLKGNPKLPTWILHDSESLHNAMQKHDPWAKEVSLFLKLPPSATTRLPF